MNNRLKQFLAAENISQAQFADSINVVRASVSHVLSGRNNPSYDFIKATMDAFPTLNIEWLMLGRGKMYKEGQVSKPAPPASDLLFQDIDDDLISPQEAPVPVQEPRSEEIIKTSYDINTLDNTTEHIDKQRRISKVIVLFDDGTFQEM